jgi:SPP1 gp7 family putative phage head morphogenesis protein
VSTRFAARPKPALSVGASDLGVDFAGIFADAYRAAGDALSAARGAAAELGSASDAAAAYADERAGSLITDIDATTAERVQGIIASAVQDGQSTIEVQSRLDTLFGTDRAEMIARTEMGTAWNIGVVNALKDAGEEYVYVSDGDYDEECQNADGEIWTLEEAEANPLEHPNCERQFRPLTEDELAEQRAEDGEEEAQAEEAASVRPEIVERLLQMEREVFEAEFDEEKHPRDDHGRWTDGGGGEATHPTTTLPVAPFKRMSELTPEQAKLRREQNAVRAKAWKERELAKREAEKLNPKPPPPPPPPPQPQPRPEPPPQPPKPPEGERAKPEPPPEPSPKLDFSKEEDFNRLIGLSGQQLTRSADGVHSVYDKNGLQVFVGRAAAGETTTFTAPGAHEGGVGKESGWGRLNVALDERGFPISLALMPGAESPLYTRYREFSEHVRLIAQIASQREADRAARAAWRENQRLHPPEPKVATEPRFRKGIDDDHKAKQAAALLYLAALRDGGMPVSHVDGLKYVETKDAGFLHYPGQEKERAGGFYNIQGRFIVIAEHMSTGARWGLAHEIGHHVHLSRLTNEAAKQWADISRSATTCRISDYGKHNTGEHFAEAYKAYFGGMDRPGGTRESGYMHTRERLSSLEPKAYSFMQMLSTGWGVLANGSRYHERNDHRYLMPSKGERARERRLSSRRRVTKT